MAKQPLKTCSNKLKTWGGKKQGFKAEINPTFFFFFPSFQFFMCIFSRRGGCLTLIDEDETDGEWAQTRLHSSAGLGAHHLKILQLDSIRSPRCSIRLRRRRPAARLKKRPHLLISINYAQVSAQVGGAFVLFLSWSLVNSGRLQVKLDVIVTAINFQCKQPRDEFQLDTEHCRKILRFFRGVAAVRTAPPSGSMRRAC